MKNTIVLALFFCSSCSLSVEGPRGAKAEVGQKSESYSYDFEYNGCKTGKKTFSSRDAYCDGLKDDKFNEFCASQIRYETFKRECSDKSWN